MAVDAVNCCATLGKCNNRARDKAAAAAGGTELKLFSNPVTYLKAEQRSCWARDQAGELVGDGRNVRGRRTEFVGRWEARVT
jgi:hypothetical protein